MERIKGPVPRSESCGDKNGESGPEAFQFAEEIQKLMTVPPENGSSFTALLELPPNQAMELLHSPESDGTPPELAGEVWSQCDCKPYDTINCSPTFQFKAAVVEQAAGLSIFSTAGDDSPRTSSVPSNSSANSLKVKNEPIDTDSNRNSSPVTSDPMILLNPRSTKRKEREKKVKGSNKKSKNAGNQISEEAEKIPYVHVRARRGQATDSHSLAERARREKINARMKLLQELVPGCSKISGTALVLDEIINHVQSLQRQVEFLSMRLAAVNPRIDFNVESLFAAEGGSLVESNFASVVMPLVWPEVQASGNRQQSQQLWHFDSHHHPFWGREFENHNFFTSENSLLSYDSSANSASLHSSQLKMEL